MNIVHRLPTTSSSWPPPIEFIHSFTLWLHDMSFVCSPFSCLSPCTIAVLSVLYCGVYGVWPGGKCYPRFLTTWNLPKFVLLFLDEQSEISVSGRSFGILSVSLSICPTHNNIQPRSVLRVWALYVFGFSVFYF